MFVAASSLTLDWCVPGLTSLLLHSVSAVFNISVVENDNSDIFRFKIVQITEACVVCIS